MSILTIINWIVANRKSLFKAVLGLSVGLLLAWGVTLSKQNKKLSESLEMAQNNIEAYQGSLQGSQQANNVLRLRVEDLHNQNDILVNKLDSVRDKLKIKAKHLQTAATQSQVINVIQSKETKDNLIQTIKDSIYRDSIQFNDLTNVSLAISKDTVEVGLDIRNTQYLYVFRDKHYKNKKNFIMRLLTFDFKKVTVDRYQIVNTNDLIKTDSVRVIKINE